MTLKQITKSMFIKFYSASDDVPVKKKAVEVSTVESSSNSEKRERKKSSELAVSYM